MRRIRQNISKVNSKVSVPKARLFGKSANARLPKQRDTRSYKKDTLLDAEPFNISFGNTGLSGED